MFYKSNSKLSQIYFEAFKAPRPISSFVTNGGLLQSVENWSGELDSCRIYFANGKVSFYGEEIILSCSLGGIKESLTILNVLRVLPMAVFYTLGVYKYDWSPIIMS